jgi:hypothetical protein
MSRYMEIPVNKTSTAYTKPVHPLVGKRIAEWEAVRPKEQLPELDPKTGESVQFLFSYRGKRIWDGYINEVLMYVIPNTPILLFVVRSLLEHSS